MTGDKLIFEVRGRRFGIDTSEVAGILEADKATQIPGQSGFVRGALSLRGEPVTIIDASMVFAGERVERTPRDKVIVVTDSERMLGIDIGPSKPNFMWAEELSGYAVSDSGDPRIKNVIEAGERPISILDCTALFEEATTLLATEDRYAKEGPNR